MRSRGSGTEGSSKGPGTLAWAFLVLLILVTTLALLHALSPLSPEKNSRKDTGKRPSKPIKKPLVSIIVDDMGQNPELERRFFELGIPLNFAFLPGMPYTELLAKEAHSKGFTVLVHIPMEPLEGPLDLPYSLRVDMTEAEVKSLVKEMIKGVPFAEGANQHTGSLFSTDPVRMKWVLETLKENGLFFVDSRTTAQTVAPIVAKELKIPFAQRGLFLDNSLEEGELEKAFEEMLLKAVERGGLVVIVHPHPQTLSFLRRVRRSLLENFELVSVKKLLEVPE